jgi:hypothetical protein
MDPHRRRAMRRAHTKHKGFCTCGKVVSGNGAKAMHFAMHERRQDGHTFLTEDAWREKFAAKPSATQHQGN